jgi:TolB protein
MATGAIGARSAPPAGLIAFAGGPGTHPDVYVVVPDGTGRRQLTRTPTDDELCPSWAPDGKRIAVTVTRGQRQSWVEVITTQGRRLWRIPGASCSGWSPDGSQILFVRNNYVYAVDADGHRARKLALPDLGSMPVWSPDGKEVAYVSASSGGNSPSEAAKRLTIVVAGLDGTVRDAIKVTPPAWCANPSCRLYDNYFAWAPGADIAFTLVQGDLYPERLYAIRPDGSGQRLLSGGLTDIYWPAWSPDGKRIAFVFRNPHGEQDEIWIATADGSGVRQVTRIRSHTGNLSGCFNPAWSPDARRLSCWGHAGGMYVVDATSGASRLIVRDAYTADDFAASWQPAPRP